MISKKDIPGYEGRYQAWSNGDIYSLITNKVLDGGRDRDGYRIVLLYNLDGTRKSKKVHRLVAETFIPNDDMLPVVNHKNEVKTDNSVENLEWCTVKYNDNYGTSIARRVEKQGRRVFATNGTEIVEFPSLANAANVLKVSVGDIALIASHGSKNYKNLSSVKGWTFSYTQDFPTTKFRQRYTWSVVYDSVIHIYPNRATLERDEHVSHQTFDQYINTGIKLPNKDFSIERRPKQHVGKGA